MDFVVQCLLQLHLLLLFRDEKQSAFRVLQSPKFLDAGFPFIVSPNELTVA